ncbi:MAG: hypothetical protein ACR2FY_16380, partial [Pirellulaceae bacterium]
MFRFSIREMMLVTLIVGLVVGWWLEHRKQQTNEEARQFAEWQLDSLTMLVEASGHKVTLYDGWKVELDSNSVRGRSKTAAGAELKSSHFEWSAVRRWFAATSSKLLETTYGE